MYRRASRAAAVIRLGAMGGRCAADGAADGTRRAAAVIWLGTVVSRTDLLSSAHQVDLRRGCDVQNDPDADGVRLRAWVHAQRSAGGGRRTRLTDARSRPRRTSWTDGEIIFGSAEEPPRAGHRGPPSRVAPVGMDPCGCAILWFSPVRTLMVLPGRADSPGTRPRTPAEVVIDVERDQPIGS